VHSVRKVSDEFTVPLYRAINASSIVTVMNPGGGRNSGSIRTRPHARYGSRRIRNPNQ
jgi:hypothetical protein